MTRLLQAVLLSTLLCCALPLSAAEQTTVVMQADTQHITDDGHRFIVPAGWAVQRNGALTVITAPEGGTNVALIDVQAANADAAVKAAWVLYQPNGKRELIRSIALPVRQGWRAIQSYRYAASDTRTLSATARQYDRGFNVAIFDASVETAERRDAQIELLIGSLVPKGYVPEKFGGVTAHRLEGKRLSDFEAFFERARQALDVPGAAVGLIQNGKLVLAKGYGVRRLGQPETVDANTRFMIASNTKTLTTLMLAKLVDKGKFSWDTPVVKVLPSFKLGNAETTQNVRMRHLVCACTGLPRQDMEYIFESEQMTAASVLPLVASMQPTSAFGELYQYSNLLAGAAGYIGGQVLNPKMEVGAAYDAAMQALVFHPLGMLATTFDNAEALRGNHARPYDVDIKGDMAAVDLSMLSINQVSRPDGGAWSTVNDLLRYLAMELNYGRLQSGERYISAAPLIARRIQQVSRGNNQGYGIGLKIDDTTGTQMLHHGGNVAGFVSDVMWWPEHDVGAVLLTNSSSGGITLRNVFRRRLMELMFDGHAEAQANVAVFKAMDQAATKAWRAELILPLPLDLTALKSRYISPELGELVVRRQADKTWFDFGGWNSEIAIQKAENGEIDFVTISPGIRFAFRLSKTAKKHRLSMSDSNRVYVFEAVN